MERRRDLEADELKEIMHHLMGDSGSGLAIVAQPLEGEDEDWVKPLGHLSVGGVLLDEAASLAIPEPYDSERIGFIPGVRREGKPFRAYRLLMRERGEVGIQPAREMLWSALSAKLLTAARLASPTSPPRGGNWIGLCGVPGSGKSFLLQALAGKGREQGWPVMMVRCLRSDPVGVFAPWRRPLAQLLQDRVAMVFKEVGEGLELSEARVEWAKGALLGDGAEAAEASELDRDLLPRVLVEVLQVAARMRGGLVVAIDDWQWLDGPGTQALEMLKKGAPGLRLMTARRGRAETDEVPVEAMTDQEGRLFLAQCAAGMRVTEDLSREVTRLSGGLPLVAREIFVALRSANGLRIVGETVDLAPGAHDRLASHGSNLSGRFSELPKGLRDFLGCCAIWGDEFSKEQVAWVIRSCRVGGSTTDYWASPILAEFVVPVASKEGCYGFYHDLLREASRNLMDEETRQAAHEAAFRWIKRHDPKAVQLKSLAFHAREADLKAEAVSLYDRLSERALSSFALREAIEAAEAADELDDEPRGDEDRRRFARRAQVAGEAAFHLGSLETAILRLEEALSHYGILDGNRAFSLGVSAIRRQVSMLTSGRVRPKTTRGSDLLRPARAALLLGEIAYFQDQRERSAKWCLLALDLAVQAGESSFLASLCAAVSCPLAGRRPRWVADRYRAIGQAMVRRQGDEDQQAYVQHVSNLSNLGRMRWKTCLSESEKAVAYWLKQGHSRREEEARIFVFYASYFQGNLKMAGEAAASLKRRSRLRTDRQTQLWGAVVAAVHALRCEGVAQARESLVGTDTESGDVMTQHAVNVVEATIAWREGKPWKALDYLVKADAFAQEAPPISPVQIQGLEAAIVLGEMRRFGPEALTREAAFPRLWFRSIRVAARFGAAYPFGRPLSMAASLLSSGSGGHLFESWSKAEAMATRLGMPLDAARIRCLGGLCEGHEGRADEGRSRLESLGARAEARHFQHLINEGRT